MIGWLHGTIGDRWQEGNRCWLLLICGPVGYELQVSESLWRGTALESPTTVHTHLQQREDGQQLYGFETKADRNLFRLLISV
ncbi:MAG: OB-fold domain-containing protein, partial [Synechococcus sp.]